MNLVSSTNPATIGNPVTLTATIATANGTPTGSVTFSDGSTILAIVPLSGLSASYTLSTLAVGIHTISVSYSGDSTFQAMSSSLTLTVAKTAPAVSLVSSLNPSILTTAVTFSAAVSSVGTPTGSVSFYDGATLLATSPMSGLQASCTTTSLAAGTHSITAVYSGDGSFITGTSTAVAQLVQDFTVSTPTSGTTNAPSATIAPGGTATYTLNIGPSVGTVFPAAVTLSLSGLPLGATGTLSPTLLPAGSSLSSVTLTIQLPQTAQLDPQRDPHNGLYYGGGLISLALLCLPVALRRGAKLLPRLLSAFLVVVVAGASLAGLIGCGARDSGFFGQASKTYTVNVVATLASLQHSTSVTLTVE